MRPSNWPNWQASSVSPLLSGTFVGSLDICLDGDGISDLLARAVSLQWVLDRDHYVRFVKARYS